MNRSLPGHVAAGPIHGPLGLPVLGDLGRRRTGADADDVDAAIKDEQGKDKGGGCGGTVNVTVNVMGTGNIGSLTVKAENCQQ